MARRRPLEHESLASDSESDTEIDLGLWCEHCAAHIGRDLAEDNDGRCRSCGGELREAAEGDEERPTAPWHFKVLVIGTLGYLVYRLIWFVFWLTGHGWHG